MLGLNTGAGDGDFLVVFGGSGEKMELRSGRSTSTELVLGGSDSAEFLVSGSELSFWLVGLQPSGPRNSFMATIRAFNGSHSL